MLRAFPRLGLAMLLLCIVAWAPFQSASAAVITLIPACPGGGEVVPIPDQSRNDVIRIDWQNCAGGQVTSQSAGIELTSSNSAKVSAAASGEQSLVVTGSSGSTTFTFNVKASNAAPAPTPTPSANVRVVEKVTICHRTRATTNPYVLITVSVSSVVKSAGHDEHDTTKTNKVNPQDGSSNGSGVFNPSFDYPSNKKWWGDIIPPFAYLDAGAVKQYPGLNWSAPKPDPTGGRDIWLEDAEFAAAAAKSTSTAWKAAVDLCTGATKKPAAKPSQAPAPAPSTPAKPAAPSKPKGDAILTPKSIDVQPGPDPGTITFDSKKGQPLAVVDVVAPPGSVSIDTTGPDFNNPLTWQRLGYGQLCWKLEPFSTVTYVLPNPVQPPAGFSGTWAYTNVIVKAGSVVTTDPNFQTNTVFVKPAPGQTVWPDINKNGIIDPGGRTGDKNISHIVICADKISQAAPTPVPTATPNTPAGPSSSASPAAKPAATPGATSSSASPSPSGTGSTPAATPGATSAAPSASASGTGSTPAATPGATSAAPSASASGTGSTPAATPTATTAPSSSAGPTTPGAPTPAPTGGTTPGGTPPQPAPTIAPPKPAPPVKTDVIISIEPKVLEDCSAPGAATTPACTSSNTDGGSTPPGTPPPARKVVTVYLTNGVDTVAKTVTYDKLISIASKKGTAPPLSSGPTSGTGNGGTGSGGSSTGSGSSTSSGNSKPNSDKTTGGSAPASGGSSGTSGSGDKGSGSGTGKGGSGAAAGSGKPASGDKAGAQTAVCKEIAEVGVDAAGVDAAVAEECAAANARLAKTGFDSRTRVTAAIVLVAVGIMLAPVFIRRRT